jgi:DNA-dependent RNA polymerase auxiliary subunit epsilon
MAAPREAQTLQTRKEPTTMTKEKTYTLKLTAKQMEHARSSLAHTNYKLETTADEWRATLAREPRNDVAIRMLKEIADRQETINQITDAIYGAQFPTLKVAK